MQLVQRHELAGDEPRLVHRIDAQSQAGSTARVSAETPAAALAGRS